MLYLSKLKMKLLQIKECCKIFCFWVFFILQINFASSSSNNVIRDIEMEIFLNDLANPLIQSEYSINLSDKYSFNANNRQRQLQKYTTLSIRNKNATPFFKEIKQEKPITMQTIKYPGTIIRKAPTNNILFNFYVVDNDSINAFVSSGGGNIYVNTGLIMAYNNTNLIRGVLAHELGHKHCHHIERSGIAAQNSKQDGLIAASLVGLVSIASGGMSSMAAGSVAGGQTSSMIAVGVGSALAGVSVAQNANFSFSREYEKEADFAGLKYLHASHFTARGLFDLMEYFNAKTGEVGALEKYFTTHPQPSERVSFIQNAMQNEDITIIKVDEQLEERFQRIRAKIRGYFGANFIEINTKYSQISNKIKSLKSFLDNYEEMFFKLKNSDYKGVIEIGNQLLQSNYFSKIKDDSVGSAKLYIMETMAQAHCILGEIEKADKYFIHIRNVIKNNSVLEYEYGECLIKYGGDEYLAKGIDVLYTVSVFNPSDLESRLLLKGIAEKNQNEGLFTLMSIEILLIEGKTKDAKEVISATVVKPTFNLIDSRYRDKITYLNDIL